jgi:single-strand DNA-binding protein
MPQNSVTIIGNLADDPEVRFTPSGQAVARFNVAYSERYRDNSTGEWKDGDTSYFTVIAWRDLAEHVAETFIRGNRVIVTGKVQQRSWETKEGDKRYAVEFIADDVGASVRFATAKISKVTRTRPDGPGSDPWADASPERPAPEPADGPVAEPATDAAQEPAGAPAEPGAATGARTGRGRTRAAQ